MQDLLIIGGGINGVGIARDAVGRGLKVTLVEKGDLASQTSSWSTKLIHGGIRYLENYEFRLVRESLREREVIKAIAPHISKPIRFVMPHVSHLRPAWLIRMGLLLYDWLGGFITLPKSKYVNLLNDYKDNPLKKNFQKGYEYSDLSIDDARLVLINAQDALYRGAEIILNTAVTNAIRYDDHWVVELSNKKIIKTKVIINASGPFVLNILKDICKVQTNKSLRLVQGSHLIVKKLYDGEQAYILQQEDSRIVFMIPYQNDYTLIGTTDKEVDSYLNPTITPEEQSYLLNAVNLFLKNQISESDIVWTYAGIRPLLEDFNQSASKVTRDYEFDLDTKGAPILSIFGGKLTTYRKLAEHALEKLSAVISIKNTTWTDKEKLPGADISNYDIFNNLVPAPMKERFKQSYGNQTSKLHSYYMNCKDGGIKITEDLYEFEVAYLAKEEMASSVEDILFRRTKLGISFPKDKINILNDVLNKYL